MSSGYIGVETCITPLSSSSTLEVASDIHSPLLRCLLELCASSRAIRSILLRALSLVPLPCNLSSSIKNENDYWFDKRNRTYDYYFYGDQFVSGGNDYPWLTERGLATIGRFFKNYNVHKKNWIFFPMDSHDDHLKKLKYAITWLDNEMKQEWMSWSLKRKRDDIKYDRVCGNFNAEGKNTVEMVNSVQKIKFMNSFISSPKCPVERDDENSVISPEGHGSACNNKFSTIEKFNNLEEFSNVLIDEDCKFEKGRHTSGYFTSGSDYETVSSCIDGSSVNKYFKAHIKVRDERITLGPFFIEEEAAMAYDESVINRRTLSRKLKQETERRRHNLTRRAAKKETEKSILKEGVSSEQAAKRAFQAASNAYASVKVDNFTLRNLEIQKKRLNFFVNELEDEDKEYEQKYEQTRKKLKELDQALFSSEILKREEPYTNKKTITKSGKQLKSQIHKILEKYVGIDKETKSISDDPESELCQINRHLNDQLQIQVSQTLEKAESLARLAEIEKNFAPLFRQHDLSSRKINALHGSIFVEQHLQSPWGGEWL